MIGRTAISRTEFQNFVQTTTRATFSSLNRVLVLVAILLMNLGFIAAQPARAQTSNPQPAILAAISASNQIVVYPDASQTPPPTQNLVPSLPAGAQPQGVAYFGSDNALISDFFNSRIFVVKISTASLLATIDTSTAGYNGTGSIAVAPDLNTALASGSSNSLSVIHGPFNASSTITTVALPSPIGGYQTQAIVFNNAGRAFVYTTTGISVLDAPYTSVAFTIPVANASSGAIGITPDGNTLLTTTLSSGTVSIFSAPFSASSTPTTLTVGGSGLDGLMVTPDGTKALVVDSSSHNAYAISAPFTSSSTVESLPLPAGFAGFEDVGISADSQTAILTGNSSSEAPVFVRAPFTAAGATSYYVPVAATNIARGNGSVRFQPPGLAPGLTISKSASATAASGSNLTYTLTFANTGSVNASSVVIRDPLPAGTTFVSATNGGTLSGGNVVFNIGSVNGNTASQNVSFTVRVTAAQGATVTNSGYTIEASGVAPIPGPPVSTTVTAAVVSTNHRVFGNGTINTGGNVRAQFGFDVSTVNGGPQATGTFIFSRNGGPSLLNSTVQNLTINSAGTSATFSGYDVQGKQPGAPIIQFVVTVTHNMGVRDTFSIQLYKNGSLTPYYNASGNLTNGFVSIT